MSGAGLVLILTVCLSMYGNVAYDMYEDMTKKTLSGRELPTDELQTNEGCASRLFSNCDTMFA
jgi:photosystem I subunit XI